MIMAAALQRGMSLNDFDDMSVGALVDYVITYNNAYISDEEDGKKKVEIRKATQEDIDNF